eukprot:TRINITY_DN32676_c0_g1_i3.p1 TRINITY_DN32676_c0_g1~~TRINITY_DN32676_c0_g1_i3.p1  ORF type:complete len:386 (-),score=147.63 TRINITY_DN32676_c0_g1_i3:110-1267(-)
MGMCPLYSSDEQQVEEGLESAPEGWDPGCTPLRNSAAEDEDDDERKLLFELRLKDPKENTLSSASFPKGTTKATFRVDFTNRPIGCHISSVDSVTHEDAIAFIATYETAEKAREAASEHHGTAIHGGMLRAKVYSQVLDDLQWQEERRIAEEERRIAEEVRRIAEEKARAEEQARIEAEARAEAERVRAARNAARKQAMERAYQQCLEHESAHESSLQKELDLIEDPGLTEDMLEEMSAQQALARFMKVNPAVATCFQGDPEGNLKTIKQYLKIAEQDNGAPGEFRQKVKDQAEELEKEWSAVQESFVAEINQYNTSVEGKPEAAITDFEYDLAEALAEHMGKPAKAEAAQHVMELRWNVSSASEVSLCNQFQAALTNKAKLASN